MRYEPAERLLRLVVELAGSDVGLTLPDIMERFGVSRRTAERLLAAVRRAMDVEELAAHDDNRKRWRIPRLSPALADPKAEEVAALFTAAESLSRERLDEHADAVRLVATKLTATLERAKSRRLAPDVAALAEAEGFASRPGPRPAIEAARFAVLRDALLAGRKVEIDYRYRSDARERRLVVHPYGFLYGARHYLVAFSEAKTVRDVRLFALPNILAARVLEAAFVPAEGFSMDAYTREMFGVFREAPVDVLWRFSAEAAADARAFQFHPDQAVTELPDGRIEIAFRAGGLKEMAWHLFTWGRHVEIVAPDELRALLLDLLKEALATHAR